MYRLINIYIYITLINAYIIYTYGGDNGIVYDC